MTPKSSCVAATKVAMNRVAWIKKSLRLSLHQGWNGADRPRLGQALSTAFTRVARDGEEDPRIPTEPPNTSTATMMATGCRLTASEKQGAPAGCRPGPE